MLNRIQDVIVVHNVDFCCVSWGIHNDLGRWIILLQYGRLLLMIRMTIGTSMQEGRLLQEDFGMDRDHVLKCKVDPLFARHPKGWVYCLQLRGGCIWLHAWQPYSVPKDTSSQFFSFLGLWFRSFENKTKTGRLKSDLLKNLKCSEESKWKLSRHWYADRILQLSTYLLVMGIRYL